MGNKQSQKVNLLEYTGKLKLEILSSIGSAFSFNIIQENTVMPYRGELNKMWKEGEHEIIVFIEACHYIYGKPASITVYVSEKALNLINYLLTTIQNTQNTQNTQNMQNTQNTQNTQSNREIGNKELKEKLLLAINNRNIFFERYIAFQT